MSSWSVLVGGLCWGSCLTPEPTVFEASWVFEAIQPPIISAPLLLLPSPLPRGNAERFLSNNLLFCLTSWGLRKDGPVRNSLSSSLALGSGSEPLASRSTKRQMTISYQSPEKGLTRDWQEMEDSLILRDERSPVMCWWIWNHSWQWEDSIMSVSFHSVSISTTANYKLSLWSYWAISTVSSPKPVPLELCPCEMTPRWEPCQDYPGELLWASCIRWLRWIHSPIKLLLSGVPWWSSG